MTTRDVVLIARACIASTDPVQYSYWCMVTLMCHVLARVGEISETCTCAIRLDAEWNCLVVLVHRPKSGVVTEHRLLVSRGDAVEDPTFALACHLAVNGVQNTVFPQVSEKTGSAEFGTWLKGLYDSGLDLSPGMTSHSCRVGYLNKGMLLGVPELGMAVRGGWVEGQTSNTGMPRYRRVSVRADLFAARAFAGFDVNRPAGQAELIEDDGPFSDVASNLYAGMGHRVSRFLLTRLLMDYTVLPPESLVTGRLMEAISATGARVTLANLVEIGQQMKKRYERQELPSHLAPCLEQVETKLDAILSHIAGGQQLSRPPTAPPPCESPQAVCESPLLVARLPPLKNTRLAHFFRDFYVRQYYLAHEGDRQIRNDVKTCMYHLRHYLPDGTVIRSRQDFATYEEWARQIEELAQLAEANVAAQHPGKSLGVTSFVKHHRKNPTTAVTVTDRVTTPGYFKFNRRSSL